MVLDLGAEGPDLTKYGQKEVPVPIHCKLISAGSISKYFVIKNLSTNLSRGIQKILELYNNNLMGLFVSIFFQRRVEIRVLSSFNSRLT